MNVDEIAGVVKYADGTLSDVYAQLSKMTEDMDSVTRQISMLAGQDPRGLLLQYLANLAKAGDLRSSLIQLIEASRECGEDFLTNVYS